MTQIIAVSGYPGSGKSSLCKILENRNIRNISMSDILRSKFQGSECAAGEREESRKSDVLGEWVDKQRERHGSDVIANWTAEYVKDNVDDELVSVDGIRSDVHVFEEEFDTVSVWFVKSCFETRLERICERGRDGESNFDSKDLVKRDRREVGWGLDDVRDRSDIVIENEGSISDLRRKVESSLNNVS